MTRVFVLLFALVVLTKLLLQSIRIYKQPRSGPADAVYSSGRPVVHERVVTSAGESDFADVEETLQRTAEEIESGSQWISSMPDSPVDDLILWRDCLEWRKVKLGTNHDICAAELGNHRWLQMGGQQGECTPGYGRGICKLFNDSSTYFRVKMGAHLAAKKKYMHSLDLSAMDKILAFRLKHIHSMFRALEGKVALVNELPFTSSHLFHKLESCPGFEKTQHSAELWIPLLLQYHQYTSLLLKRNRTSYKGTLYYLSVFPQLHTQCHGDGHELFHLGHEHTMEAIRTVINSTLWKDSHHGYNLFVPATHPLAPLGNFDLLGRPSFLTVDYEGSGRYPRDIVVPYVADQRHLPHVSFNRRTRLIVMVSSWFNPEQTVRRSIEVAYADYLNDQEVSTTLNQ